MWEHARLGGLVLFLLVGCAAGEPHGAERAQLQWLIDRAQLEDLMNRYVYAVDAIDRDALAGVFTPDAVLEVTFADPEAEAVRQRGFDAIFQAMSADLCVRPARYKNGSE